MNKKGGKRSEEHVAQAVLNPAGVIGKGSSRFHDKRIKWADVLGKVNASVETASFVFHGWPRGFVCLDSHN